MTAKRITIVGCGPGGADYLTPLAREAAQRADVLIGARRLLDLFPMATGEKVAVNADVRAALAALEGCGEDRAAAVLVTGDPGVCSLGRSVIARFGPGACRVIPGISSVQVAFARLGEDWHDARIISAHGSLPALDIQALAGENKIAVLTGGKTSFGWAADLAGLLGSGWQIYLGEDLTLAGEWMRPINPEELRTGSFSSLSIIVMLRSSRGSE